MKFGLFAALAAILLIIIVGNSAIFTVSQTEQALVLRFGEPQSLVTQPGLHFKQPFVESVVYLDNRILDLEGAQEEVLASDSQRILVDAFVRYHIADPLKFYQTVGTIARANNQLASVLNSAVRRVLGDATLPQIIKDDRAGLMVKIRDQVNSEAARLGAAVNDVRIRRADLPKEISEKVYSRMQSERAREAAEYRAQGSEQAQTITAKADRDVVVIKAEAQRQADQTRGEGDAARNKIFAEAYGKDPGFFAFYRSMQAYASGLKAGDTRLVLSPSSNFFRFFNDPAGTAPSAAAPQAKASGPQADAGMPATPAQP
ncbi:protease modulator HflC [Lichenihabitans sp. PAMC28606]|uniref:protease modulator HflC n=1 Tax=Lichenihabitans sp. PAMC28606 TaxID=2880932 RepID=UPI001D0AAFE7|nr:protease modulator HflC [Lichenihabitans sp. PAMC28606]UDL93621.1 protease modulator HflC [Lichenihabitans sp. PAMC28606]